MIELVEALSYNRSLTLENRHVIMHNLVRMMIIKGWSLYFKKNVSFLCRLIVALFELDYYYSPLLLKAVMSLVDHPKFLNLNKIDMIYQVLVKINEEKKDILDLTEYIQRLEDKLRSRESYHWRYNVDKGRFYTYKEMKEKRENVDLSGCEQFAEGLIPCPEEDKRVWQDHWIHLVMKRDLTKYMKKLKDLDDQRTPYEIDFENFNPTRWHDNIKLLTDRKSDDMDFLDESEETENQHQFEEFSDQEE